MSSGVGARQGVPRASLVDEDPHEILLRALDRRARELALRSGTGELLMLVAGDGPAALGLLSLDDLTFKSRAAKADEELG